MLLDISAHAPDSEFALLTAQQVKSALAESEINAIAGEVHRLTGAYAQIWMERFQSSEDIDTVVTVPGPLSPTEQIALHLMAQMAVDAIGEPLSIEHSTAVSEPMSR